MLRTWPESANASRATTPSSDSFLCGDVVHFDTVRCDFFFIQVSMTFLQSLLQRSAPPPTSMSPTPSEVDINETFADMSRTSSISPTLDTHEPLPFLIPMFKCGLCDVKFAARAPLLKHRRLVHSNQLWTCRCGRIFRTPDELREHQTLTRYST